MPETIYCPECDGPVSLPGRLLGKIARCPSCRATFRAEVPAKEEPVVLVVGNEPSRPASREPIHAEEEVAKQSRGERGDGQEEVSDEDLPGPQPTRRPLTVDELASWRRVRFGLTFVLAGTIVGLLANIGGAMGLASVDPYSTRDASVLAKVNMLLPRMLWDELRPAAVPTGRFAVTMIFFFSACACAAGLAIAGNVFCMAIPNQRKARSTLTSSVATLCLGLFLFSGAWVYQYVRFTLWQNGVPQKPIWGSKLDSPPLEGIIIFIFGGSLLLAQPALFSVFLRNVARAVRANRLATTLILPIVLPVMGALGFVLASISWYSALKGAIDAKFAGTHDAAFVAETAAIAEPAIKVLYFVYVGYAVCFVASLIATRIAITRAMRYAY